MALSAEEQAEMTALQAEPTTPKVTAPGQPVQKASGLTPEEQAEMQSLHAEVNAPAHPIKDALATAGKSVLWGLGVAGDTTRATLAKLLEHRLKSVAGTAQMLGANVDPGKINFTQPDDLPNALKAQGPHVSDYLERAGVPTMGRLSDLSASGYAKPGEGRFLHPERGGILDPSVRGAVGLVGDVVTDPLTYLSGGLSAAAKGGEVAPALKAALLANEQGLTTGGKALNYALNPLEVFSRKGATSAYQKAFEKVDDKIALKGLKPETLAQIAQETGFWGSPQSAVEHFAGINQKAGENIGQIMTDATAKGAQVDLQGSLRGALEEAAKKRALGTPEGNAVAKQIEDRVQLLRDTHTTTSTSPVLKDGVTSAAPQSEATMFDPYHSVEQDSSRVLTTETPTLFANGEIVSSKKPTLMMSANSEAPNLTIENRTRAFTPLEQDPKMGQLDMGLADDVRVTPPTLTSKVDRSAKIGADFANKIKTDINSNIKFGPVDDTVANEARKAVATPLSVATKEAVKDTDQELYDRLIKENARFSSTSPKVQEKLAQFGAQAPQQKGAFGMGKMDSWFGAGGAAAALNGHTEGLIPFLAGKIYQAGASFEGRTARGALLDQIGKKSNGVTDEVLRQFILNQEGKQNEK